MPLRLNVGVSRKVGLPDYGSVGASCNLELEVESSLIDRDLEAFHARVRDAYVAAHQAVHDELARQAMHEEELLAGHELGREVLLLRAERENLLDSIWLATSPSQIRSFWQKVGELLGEEPSPLERTALSISPEDKEG